MKLYYSPGACSLSPHIALCETGLAFELEKVDLSKKLTQSGRDFLTINPKGYVPALELDSGEMLTEGPAIVQYIADLAPASKLAPAAGTIARYHLQEWLNFISTEIHKTFSGLFNQKALQEYKNLLIDKLSKRLDYLEQHLSKHPFLLGEGFTVADGYLFTTLRWSPHVKVDLKGWQAVAKYMAEIAERPAVKAAMQAEEIGQK